MSTHQLVAADERQLRLFRLQYLQLLEPKYLSFPSLSALRNMHIQSWLYENIFNPQSLTYSPPERYQLRVLKELVARIENAVVDPEEDEVSDDLMSLLSVFMAMPMPSEFMTSQRKNYVTYARPNLLETVDQTPQEICTLESRSVIMASGGTGHRTWEAALCLATYLSSSAGIGLVKGKRLLELGAGTGFLSILCAKHLKAERVVVTDGDDDVIDDLQTNLVLNGLDESPKISPEILKWGRTTAKDDENDDEDKGLDVIIGADLTYDVSVIPALVGTLRELIGMNHGAQALISATIRNEQTFNAFISACENSLNIKEVDFTSPPLELQTGFFHQTSTPIRIVSLTASKSSYDPFSIR